jgi:broad specificity phosphatase PhoE
VASPTIALIRHGSTGWAGQRYAGRTDVPLDTAGRLDALRLADDLAGSLGPGDRLVSSPLDRALTTARTIAAATGATVETDERWQEVDFGAVEGLTFDEVERRWPDLARRLAAGDTAIDWPGGETAAAFEARVLAAWTELRFDARTVAVVAHAGPIRLVLARAAGRPAERVSLPAPGSIVWVPDPVAIPPSTAPAMCATAALD